MLLLIVIGLAESAIMLVLYTVVPQKSMPAWLYNALDTLALVAICTPVMWRFFLQPLRRAALSESMQAGTIMESVADGIVVVDEQGMVRAFNPAAEALFGYAASDVIGRPVFRLLPEAQRGRHEALLREYLQSGRASLIGQRTELEAVRRDGSRFPIELAVSEHRLLGHHVFTAIARDLTEQKRAAAAIAQANHLLEKIFTNLHVSIAYLDADFNFIRVNAAYAAAHGEAPEFFPGRNYFGLYPNAQLETIFHRVSSTGESYAALAQPRTGAGHAERDGTYWDWFLHPIKSPDGRVESLLLTLTEVTQQVRAQQLLSEKEKNERALLDATTEAAFLLASDGTILMANQTGAKRFGRKSEEMRGNIVFAYLPREVATRQRNKVYDILLDGEPASFEDEWQGHRYRTNVYPIQDEDRNTLRIALYSADITETHRLQGIEKLLRAVDEHILKGAPLDALLTLVCTQVAALFDLRLVWIGEKKPDGSITLLAAAGPAAAYQDDLLRTGVRWDDSPTGHSSAGAAIRLGKTQRHDPGSAACSPWAEAARAHGLASACGIPLIIRGETFGVLTLYSARVGEFDDTQIVHRLESIATRLAVALEAGLDHEQLRLLRAALSTASNAVYITDQHGTIQWVNESFLRLSGYTAHEAIGNNPRMLKSGMQDEAYYETLWQTILSGETFSSETAERRRDGTLYTVKQTITPVRDDAGRIRHFIAMHEDITEQRAARARIEHMAHFDALTGLPNRSLFFDRLDQAMAQSQRTQHRAALLFLDLDRFKPVNDAHGHAVGDVLLKAVAGRLQACVRETDTVARIAGDEFTIILSQLSAAEDAGHVAAKIVKAIGQPFHFDGIDISIGTSIGIALFPDDSREPEELIRLADHAMYVAKHSSRNTYRFHKAVET